MTCSSTSFPTVPDTLIVPSFSPIGLFLLFKDYLSDPLLASDSISVVMGYTQSDLQTIGNPSENILAVSWITADPIGFQLVDANTDTTATVDHRSPV